MHYLVGESICNERRQPLRCHKDLDKYCSRLCTLFEEKRDNCRVPYVQLHCCEREFFVREVEPMLRGDEK